MKMTRTLFLLLMLVTSIWAYVNKEQANKIHENTGGDFLSIQLIDTFSNDLRFDTASYLTVGEYRPIYIGKKTTTTTLTYNFKEIEYRPYGWRLNWSPDSTNLMVFIDTTRFIGSTNRSMIPPPPPPDSSEAFDWNWVPSRGSILSYPIFIKNKSNDTLSVGYGQHIPLILEAQDSLGAWQPIQKLYKYGCGTGLTSFCLLPDEIMITSCKLYQGKYQTKMRLAFGFKKTNYSNEFVGSMNYKQFEAPENYYYY